MSRISDSILEHPERWALAVLLAVLAFVAIVDGRPAVRAWGGAPALLAQRVAAVQGSVERVPEQIVAQVLPAARGEIQATRRDLLAAVRSEVLPRVDEAAKRLDSRAQDAAGSIAGLRTDLRPVLANAAALAGNGAALARDAQDSLDDLYPDVKATVESATVAVTSAAHASEAVRDAAPKVAQSVVGIGQSADAIAADVRRETDEITRPRKWWQKALGPVYTIGRIVGTFL